MSHYLARFLSSARESLATFAESTNSVGFLLGHSSDAGTTVVRACQSDDACLVQAMLSPSLSIVGFYCVSNNTQTAFAANKKAFSSSGITPDQPLVFCNVPSADVTQFTWFVIDAEFVKLSPMTVSEAAVASDKLIVARCRVDIGPLWIPVDATAAERESCFDRSVSALMSALTTPSAAVFYSAKLQQCVPVVGSSAGKDVDNESDDDESASEEEEIETESKKSDKKKGKSAKKGRKGGRSRPKARKQVSKSSQNSSVASDQAGTASADQSIEAFMEESGLVSFASRHIPAYLQPSTLDLTVLVPSGSSSSATLSIQHVNQSYASLSLSPDVVCAVSVQSTLCDIADLLRIGLLRQLNHFKQLVIHSRLDNISRIIASPCVISHWQATAEGATGFPILTPVYCIPKQLDSASATNEAYIDEQWLSAQRQSLHQCFGLSCTSGPMLRLSNSIDALPVLAASLGVDLAGQSGRLLSPHQSVEFVSHYPSTGVSQPSQLYQVQRQYAYYHYMQDKFNDNGWGCAYRSLQTICSWLLLQQATSLSVPTHEMIQEILVRMGDKRDSFIGSREWIGAIELSYVLQERYQIDCKILTVSSGAEIPSKAREIARHFSTHGSPIMMGGGMLAYTLLGIDWNEATGDCRFLILDPHYVGSEDLKTIVAKGWCGWKTVDLFAKNSFYNLCLPLRPKSI